MGNRGCSDLEQQFNYRTKLANLFESAAIRIKPRQVARGAESRFVDLAPTDKADEAGVYSAALTEATDNPRVMNIALTGPYGSGKSSIIKSFLKRYKRRALQISLAAFMPEAGTAEAVPGSTVAAVGRQEIERSILQQMLYGADANRLPLSRFKRIQSPGRWSGFASLFIVVGIVALWHLIQRRDAVMTGAFFRPFDVTNWYNLLAFGVGGLFLWLVFHHIYVASFGISLKSISLKDIEITPKTETEESILNRHLDEIIYFFQSTSYDLVIIEDLDRFNNADIFVTLREINSLVNANEGVKRPVRFLYALRDDMFVNTDRTKFFEFIIPVIPIINSSNSIDKVLEQGKRLSLDKRLKPQFLREVSRYLDDLRLIQNIFNEYAIYVANLEPEGETNLDANRLLAVLIYKNVFPSDFENLHRGKGNLASILHAHDRLVTASEAKCRAEISRLEQLLDIGERQLPNDLDELRRSYAMALIEMVPEGHSHVSFDRSNFISINTLSKSDHLESFIESKHIWVRSAQGYQQQISVPELQSKVDPHNTFSRRKEDVEKKATTFRDTTFKAIRDLRTRLPTLRMTKFDEMLRENAVEIEELFEGFGERADLARFLVLEGYLDDTYYQYTSLFHSGRLSPSDNKFLIRIRSFSNPEPDFQIDNPREVIAAMRDEDFSRNYVLNVKIIDGLLADPSPYAMQISRLLNFVASDFEGCESFLASYYAHGAAVPELMARLTRAWPDFVIAALASPANLTHVAGMISHLTDTQLKSLADKHPALTVFVSQNLAGILEQGVDFPPERLKLLDMETVDLASVASHPGFVRALFDGGLYAISIDNLNFIFRSVFLLEPEDGLAQQNYTRILSSGNEPLLSKVEGQFDEYLENVLLRLPENELESVEALRRVVARNDLEREPLVSFLKRQSNSLPNLDDVPDVFQVVLFEIEKIKPTWQNCLAFQRSGSFHADVLTDFLNSDATIAALRGCPMPDEPEGPSLGESILENDALIDDAYAAYVPSLPYKLEAFPTSIGAGKMKILIDRNLVVFSADNLSHLAGNPALGVGFVTNNIDEFFEQQDECELDDDFRHKLLEADVDDATRLKILATMDLSILTDERARATLVGDILARTRAMIDNLSAEAARAVILSANPIETQISLLNLLHEMFDIEQVREILQSMPSPLPDIKTGWGTPRLADTPVNVDFATWLKSRNVISSWSRGTGFFDHGIRINLFRK